MTYRLLISDDQPIIRDGIRALLAGSKFETAGEAATADETLRQIESLRPDILLQDIRIPPKKNATADCSGLDILSKTAEKYPEIKVVMLSTYDNPSYIARAVALGAKDFLLKTTDRDTLIETLTSAAEDRSPLPSGEFHRIAAALEDSGSNVTQTLTKRETQVLRHIGYGLSNREIAKSLSVSFETIKEHVQNILRKLSLNDRTQAAVWAVRNRLV